MKIGSEDFKYRPIHPFPARMAPEIAFSMIDNYAGRNLTILDPMCGSGTTLLVAKLKGHHAIGFDTDPMAVMISNCLCNAPNSKKVLYTAGHVLEKAEDKWRSLPNENAYPAKADDETKRFIDFWFDQTSKRQMAALSNEISKVRELDIRRFLWCALSRLIITKSIGVSLAADVSHSRPHRVYLQAPIHPIPLFMKSLDRIISSPIYQKEQFKNNKALITAGDARKIKLANESVDLVITSPPYLNAIDYIRGHKLFLVWMGRKINTLRAIRASNIGTENALGEIESSITKTVLRANDKIPELPARLRSMINKYINDMNLVMSETKRVLRCNGKAVFVVGDSTRKGHFIQNSKIIIKLGKLHGLKIRDVKRRPISENSRYLPPPTHENSGVCMQKRMREEVIISFSCN